MSVDLVHTVTDELRRLKVHLTIAFLILIITLLAGFGFSNYNTGNCKFGEDETQDSGLPSGVYALSLRLGPFSAVTEVNVRCEMSFLSGGWTVLQRRGDLLDWREDFDRGLVDYVLGFGDVRGEHWLGLEAIHALTEDRQQQLLVTLTDELTESEYIVRYDYFHVSDSSANYSLNVGGFASLGNSSAAADGLGWSNGCQFSARGFDNDKNVASECALIRRCGFWFRNCSHSNVNGLAPESVPRIRRSKEDVAMDERSVMWWKGLGRITKVQLMVRSGGFLKTRRNKNYSRTL